MKSKYLSLAALIVLTGSLVVSNVLAETPTGLCNDGTPYLGANKQGACRGHKGIKEWYGNAAPTPVAAAESKSTAAANPANPASNAIATGTCKDGTPYTGSTKQGACRGHKGIKEWFADNKAAQPAAATTTAAAPAPTATPAASGAATGLCKDGTPYTGTTKQGACRGHKGIKEWYGTTAAATPNSAPVAAEKPAATTATPEPEEKSAPVSSTPVAGGSVDKVWVNDDSKIYHCHGTRFYGMTKSGSYMTEQQAIAGGNRADHNKPCHK